MVKGALEGEQHIENRFFNDGCTRNRLGIPPGSPFWPLGPSNPRPGIPTGPGRPGNPWGQSTQLNIKCPGS